MFTHILYPHLESAAVALKFHFLAGNRRFDSSGSWLKHWCSRSKRCIVLWVCAFRERSAVILNVFSLCEE